MEKMLIVDDNGDLRKILKLTFSYGKYQLFEADTGAKGIEIAERELPEVILLDIMMPGMDGIEVCRRIRANPALEKSYVIMLTALGQKSDVEKGYAAGANFYMAKPFSPIQLISVIEGARFGKDTPNPMDNEPAINMRWSDQK